MDLQINADRPIACVNLEEHTVYEISSVPFVFTQMSSKTNINQ